MKHFNKSLKGIFLLAIMIMVAGCNRDSIKVTIHYESEYGTVQEDKNEKSGYTLSEEDLKAPQLDEEINFTFDGWYYEIEGQQVKAETGDEVNVNLTLTAKWTEKATEPNNEPAEDPNNNNNNPAQDPNNTPAEDPNNNNNNPAQDPNNNPAQDPNNPPAEDPNNEPAQEPEKAKYNITYTTEYGTAPAAKEVEEGYKLTAEDLPALTQIGYVFGGWDKAVDFEVKAALSLTATWTPATNTAYKVEHYQENVADAQFTLKDTDNLTGTTNADTAAVAKTYDGFTVKAFEQAKIEADGSTVIKIYYNRLSSTTVNLSFTAKDIEVTPAENGIYFTLTPAAGYTDFTWTLNGNELNAICSVDANGVLSFNKEDAANGVYTFTLKAKKGGITYTTSLEITIDGQNN